MLAQQSNFEFEVTRYIAGVSWFAFSQIRDTAGEALRSETLTDCPSQMVLEISHNI